MDCNTSFNARKSAIVAECTAYSLTQRSPSCKLQPVKANCCELASKNKLHNTFFTNPVIPTSRLFTTTLLVVVAMNHTSSRDNNSSNSRKLQ
jgi:hypothetical protein